MPFFGFSSEKMMSIVRRSLNAIWRDNVSSELAARHRTNSTKRGQLCYKSEGTIRANSLRGRRKNGFHLDFGQPFVAAVAAIEVSVHGKAQIVEIIVIEVSRTIIQPVDNGIAHYLGQSFFPRPYVVSRNSIGITYGLSCIGY